MVTTSQFIIAIFLAILTGISVTAVKQIFFPEQPRWPVYVLCGVLGWFAIDIVKALGF